MSYLVVIACAALLISCGGPKSEQLVGDPPNPPVDLMVDQVSEGVRVSWKPTETATQYTVFCGSESGMYRNLFNARECSLVIGNFHDGNLYTFAVTAWNENGESQFSREEALVYDRDRKRAASHYQRGSTLMAQGSHQQAYAYLNAAIRLDPDNAEAYRTRALLNEKLNRQDLAGKDRALAEQLHNKKLVSLHQNNR
jgi:hypothetical protein